MKTPAEIMAAAPGRLAEILRRGINGERRTPQEIERLEAEWAEQERAERAAHAERQRAEWFEHLARCGAPDRVHAEAARNLVDTPAVKAARACLNDRKQSLVLSGWTGTGKTVAACLLFGAARRVETRTGYGLREWDASRGLFVDFRRLLRVTDSLRFNRASDMPPADRRLFEDACRVQVLVLDEVGGEPGEDLDKRHKALLEELVNHRDAPGRVTGYTTNLSIHRKGEQPSDFAAFIGARNMSRIGRSCIVQDCGTRDMRQVAP